MKYILLILFSIQVQRSIAQNISIPAKLLVGQWESTDSSKRKFEFTDSIVSLLLLNPRGDQTYFFGKDSLNNVYSSGYAPNWPPFDCDLVFIDAATLEITFSQLGVHPYAIRLRRVK